MSKVTIHFFCFFVVWHSGGDIICGMTLKSLPLKEMY